MDGGHEGSGDQVQHQDAIENVVNDTVDDRIAEDVEGELEDASDVAVLADLPAFSAAYVEAEMIALRTSHNKILEVLRDAGLIPTA